MNEEMATTGRESASNLITKHSSTTLPVERSCSDEDLIIKAAQALPLEHQQQVNEIVNAWQAGKGETISDVRVAILIVELYRAGITGAALDELREPILYGPASKFPGTLKLAHFRLTPDELRSFRNASQARERAIAAARQEGYATGKRDGLEQARAEQLQHERDMHNRAVRLKGIDLTALEENLNMQRSILDRREQALNDRERALRKVARRVGIVLPAEPEKQDPRQTPAAQKPVSTLSDALASIKPQEIA